MAEITAGSVKELRERPGAGMMDCKKALAENNGEMEAAIDWLRAKGLSAAAKKAGRTAAEGLVGEQYALVSAHGHLPPQDLLVIVAAHRDHRHFAARAIHDLQGFFHGTGHGFAFVGCSKRRAVNASFWSRAKFTAAMTSAASTQRAIMRGRRSIIAL